jgi:hypothetical protein
MTEIHKFQTKSFWSFGIGAWNLFGLPTRSRFGEGRDLSFGIWNLIKWEVYHGSSKVCHDC